MVDAIDTSFYNKPTNQPVNYLQMAGQYQGLLNAQAQNALLQQELPLYQAKTQQEQNTALYSNAKTKALQMLNDPQYINPQNSTLDTNKWIADMAKDPTTAMYVPDAIATRSTLNAATKSGGVDAGGVPLQAAAQAVGAKLNPTGAQAPTITTEPPQGFTTPLMNSRNNYNAVDAQAKDAPDKLAAFGQMEDLLNEGAKTGTASATAYQKLAQTGLVPEGLTKPGEQTQALAKYIERVVVGNGLPDSDYRAQKLASSNISPEQLTETVQQLEPFMKASTQGLVAKQAYYNAQTKNGTDLTGEPAASQKWNQNYDPRLLEYDALPTASAKSDFLRTHPDMANPATKQKYKNLQAYGVVNGQ